MLRALVNFFENFDFWALDPSPKTQSWTLDGLKTFGHSKEGINGLMCPKFGIVIAWVNPEGGIFKFFENFYF